MKKNPGQMYSLESMKSIKRHTLAQKMTDGELCLLCKAKSRRSFLHTYQINLEEAIVLCENPQCSFPVGSTNSCSTFSRNFDEVQPVPRKDVCSSVPEAQVALQARMADYAKNNTKLLKTVTGTQTDKRPISRLSSSFTAKLKSQPTNGNITVTVDNRELSLLHNSSGHLLKTDERLNVKLASKSSMADINQGCNQPQNRQSVFSDVSDMNVFSGFRFTVKEKSQKQISKSEPPLDRLKNSMFVSDPKTDKTKAEAISLNAKSIEMKPKLSSKSSVTGIDSIGSSVHSVSEKVTAKQRKLCHERAQSFFQYPIKFIQWKNTGALCWLDVVLCHLVHNRHVHNTVFRTDFNQGSVLLKLLKAHKQAQDLLAKIKSDNFQNLLQTDHQGHKILSGSSSQELVSTDDVSNSPRKVEMKLVSQDGSVDVKTGAGNISSGNFAGNGTDGDLSDSAKVSEIDRLLNNVREAVWQRLQPKLKFERGRNDSPVFTMSALLREHTDVEKLFKMKYSFRCDCRICGHCEEDLFDKVLPTFPKVVKGFKISEPCHSKICPHCGFKDARRTMIYKELSDCLMMHFTEGLPYNNWNKLELDHHGTMYTVTGVVQYINNPDHFIAWLRNPTDGQWMKCDDLLSPVCTYQSDVSILPNQIHMVMWEKVPEQGDSGSIPCKADKLSVGQGSGCALTENLGTEDITAVDKNLNLALFAAFNSQTVETGLLMGPDQNGESRVNLAAGETSANTSEASVIPSGRFFIPKESRSSSSSSACSAVSEALPNFNSAPPDRLVKPLPCRNEVHGPVKMFDTGTNFFEKSISNLSGNMLSADKCVEQNGKCFIKTLAAAADNGTRDKENIGSLTQENTSLSGKKCEIRPSTVFCAPSNFTKIKLEKKSSTRMKAQNTYPPYCVQNNINKCTPGDGDKKSVTNVPVSNTITNKPEFSNLNTMKWSLPETEQFEASSTSKMNASLEPVLDQSGTSSGTEKSDKFKHSTVQRYDKSLITYLRSKRISSSVMDRKNSMTLYMNQKFKSEPDLKSYQSVPHASLNDSNAAYLGKVQQYLLNKVSVCESKFDGLKLKSLKPETVNTRVTSENDTSLNSVEKLAPCSGHISPMSEWFGRKANSPPRSSHSGITGAKKRKLSTEVVNGDNKRTCIEHSLTNRKQVSSDETKDYQARNHEVAKMYNGGPRKESFQKTAYISGRFETRNKIPVSPKKMSHQPPGNSDCVLQDLYEALNIPFEDVGTTMANIMSDVDDILNLVKPVEMTHEVSRVDGATSIIGHTNILQTSADRAGLS